MHRKKDKLFRSALKILKQPNILKSFFLDRFTVIFRQIEEFLISLDKYHYNQIAPLLKKNSSLSKEKKTKEAEERYLKNLRNDT